MALLPVVLVAATSGWPWWPGADAPAGVGPVGGRGGLLAGWGHGAGPAGGLVQGVGALADARVGVGPAPIDLVTQGLFLAISVGVVVLLMTSATSRDFRSSSQSPAGTNGRYNSVVATTTPRYWLWCLVALVVAVAHADSAPAPGHGFDYRAGGAGLGGPGALLEPVDDRSAASPF